MKVLVDECVPLKLVRLLTGHSFATAQQKGRGGFKNGRLLALAEPEFDLFLTSDRNVQYQQNLKGRKIAIVVLSGNRWRLVQRVIRKIVVAVNSAEPGSYTVIEVANR